MGSCVLPVESQQGLYIEAERVLEGGQIGVALVIGQRITASSYNFD